MKLIFEIKTDSVTLCLITIAAIVGLSNIGTTHDSLPIAVGSAAGVTIITYVVVTKVFAGSA